MIFDIDGSDTEDPDTQGKDTQANATPSKETGFISTPSTHQRNDSSKQQHSRSNGVAAGLPSSFVALRPMSLPPPSNVRPPFRTQVGQPTPELGLSARRSAQHRTKRSTTLDFERPLKQHELELRKLVAADVPSHRGAWNHAEVWRTFGRKGKGKGGSRLGTISPTIEEEGESGTEDDDEDGGLGGNRSRSYNDSSSWRNYRPVNLSSSLPVAMGPVQELSTKSKSHAMDSMLTPLEEGNEEERAEDVQPEKLRRQAYAERDRVRASDPGVLDFATDEDDDETNDVNTISSSRGKHYALKIIAARNAVPEEGMWRSLA